MEQTQEISQSSTPQVYMYQLNDDSRKHNKTIVLDNFA